MRHVSKVELVFKLSKHNLSQLLMNQILMKLLMDLMTIQTRIFLNLMKILKNMMMKVTLLTIFQMTIMMLTTAIVVMMANNL